MSHPKMEDGNVFEQVARSAAERLARDSQIRRNLPGSGRLYVERALPFLCIYRFPPGRKDRGTVRLVTTMSSYLAAPGDETYRDGIQQIVEAVACAGVEEMGAFLLVEIWSPRERRKTARTGFTDTGIRFRAPSFRITAPEQEKIPETMKTLVEALEAIRLGPEENVGRKEVSVTVESSPAEPPGLPLVYPSEGAPHQRIVLLGIEVNPIYRHPSTGAPFPETLRLLRREFQLALQKVAFTFARSHTRLRPVHFHALGRRNPGRVPLNVDRVLSDVASSYDFLFSVTPTNSDRAWQEFRSKGYDHKPRLLYRPLPFDPQQLKRRLFHVPIERIEDTVFGDIFREKQDEIDREITMLQELGTRNFLYGSMRRYGGVDAPLLKLAESLLKRLPPRAEAEGKREYVEERESRRPEYVGAEEFRTFASAEIRSYTALDPGFHPEVEFRSDMVAGLMVSRGRLCVNQNIRTPRSRVNALLQHEIGTHLLTWHNGGRQPFRQLRTGLAGYELLQEGLAVLSEYLVGGLSASRTRVLAGRVIAVHALTEGASFIETFRELRRRGFRKKAAFLMTVRVYRGGGFTKDAVYLQGIRDILSYLAKGGMIEPLLVGKIAFAHLPLMEELRLRDVLRPPRLKPRYLSDPAALERLEASRRMSVFELVRKGEK